MNARHLLTIGLCAVLVTCKGSESTGPSTPAGPARLVKAAGDAQDGLAGQALPQGLKVQVLNAAGTGVPNIWVRFTSNGGTVSPDSTQSDAGGIAQAIWTLPLVSGSYSVTAAATGIPSVTFSGTVASSSVGQATQTIGAAGGTVVLAVPGTGRSLQVVMPAAAIQGAADVSVQLLPVPTSLLPAGAVPLAPLIRLSGPGSSDSVISVRVPVAYSRLGASAYQVDPSGLLHPLIAINTDSSTVTIALRALDLAGTGERSPLARGARASAGATPVDILLKANQPGTGVLDTKFRPGDDDWEFPNLGSVLAPSGMCHGQTLSMAWYFSYRRNQADPSTRLYGRYSEIPNFGGDWWVDYDDRDGVRLASAVQAHMYADLIWDIRKITAFLHSGADEATWDELVDALQTTQQPVTISVREPVSGKAHALLVWQIDASSGKISVADPNHPGRMDRFVQYNLTQKAFEPYNSAELANDPNSIAYTEIRFVPLMFWEDNLIAAHWSQFDSHTIGSISPYQFPLVSLVNATDGSSIAPGFVTQTDEAVLQVTVPSPYAVAVFDKNGAFLQTSHRSSPAELPLVAGSKTFEGEIFLPILNADGTTARLDFVDYVAFGVSANPQPPTAGGVTPTSGPLTGGTSVTITGAHFMGATGVAIGGNALANVVVVSSTQITGTTPASSTAGTKDVVVVTSAGTSAPCLGCFTYLANTIAKLSGDNQLGARGAVLPQPLVMVVKDANGTAVSGVTVDFGGIASGGGSVQPTSAVTNAQGQAQTVWTMGVGAGNFTVDATIHGTTTKVTFTASTVLQLVKVSGDGQTGAGGVALPQPLKVRFTEANGTAVSGQTVTFAVTAGGGSVSPTSVATDAQGLAQTTWTLGTSGTQTATAAVSVGANGSPATFSATVAAVAPPNLMPTSISFTPTTWGTNTQVTVNYTIANLGGPLTCSVCDPGTTLSFYVGLYVSQDSSASTRDDDVFEYSWSEQWNSAFPLSRQRQFGSTSFPYLTAGKKYYVYLVVSEWGGTNTLVASQQIMAR